MGETMQTLTKILVFFLIVLAVGLLIINFKELTHVPRYDHQSAAYKNALSRARRLSIYADIEALERKREKRIEILVGNSSSGANLNSSIVALLEDSHVDCSDLVSNVAGISVLVDGWGKPYQITINTNPHSGAADRRIVIYSEGIENHDK
jgi:hypothetical protein